MQNEAQQENKINLKYVPFPNPEVIIQEDDRGCIVLVNFDSGHAISLNRMGRFIWESADGKATVQEILDKISETFSGVPENLEDDIIPLVRILKQNGFFGEEIIL